MALDSGEVLGASVGVKQMEERRERDWKGLRSRSRRRDGCASRWRRGRSSGARDLSGGGDEENGEVVYAREGNPFTAYIEEEN